MPDVVLVDAPVEAPGDTARAASRRSPCTRFAWGTAATGGVLFFAGLVEVAGTWSISAGAVSLTVASVAGVIAMEACEERAGRSSASGRPRSRTRTP